MEDLSITTSRKPNETSWPACGLADWRIQHQMSMWRILTVPRFNQKTGYITKLYHLQCLFYCVSCVQAFLHLQEIAGETSQSRQGRTAFFTSHPIIWHCVARATDSVITIYRIPHCLSQWYINLCPISFVSNRPVLLYVTVLLRYCPRSSALD